jgi:chromosome segregation ATPase
LAVQNQLKIQLESLQERLHLVEEEKSNLKSEILPLRETNLKLQKSVMELESETDQLSVSTWQ